MHDGKRLKQKLQTKVWCELRRDPRSGRDAAPGISGDLKMGFR